MEYLLLIYNRESDWAALTEEARGALYKEYHEFTEGILFPVAAELRCAGNG